MSNVFETAGEVSVFGFQAVTDLFRRPFEGEQIRRQLAEIGSKSLPLVIASGFALGAALALHMQARFQFDPRDVGIVPLKSLPPKGLQHAAWDGICIVWC